MRALLIVVLLLSTPWRTAHASDGPPVGTMVDLAPRPFLGIAANGSETGDGIVIQEVIPGGTAAALGLSAGDTVLAVSGTSVGSMSGLIEVLADRRADAAITMTVKRSQATKPETLTGVLSARPEETWDNGNVAYTAVQTPFGPTRMIVNLPTGRGKRPVLFYLQGFSCSSIDYAFNTEETVARFVRDIADQEVVVVRMEKPGVGDSLSDKSCEDLTYDEEVAAFAAGYQALKEIRQADLDRVFLFGHSLGGITAPLLAAEFNPAGIIVYGTVTKPWFEYTVDVFRDQPFIYGKDPAEVEKEARLAIPLMYDIMYTNKNWDKIKRDNKAAIDAQVWPISGDYVLTRKFTFLRTLNAVDLIAAYRDYEGKVLALHGSHDLEAITEDAAVMTADIVNYYHPGNGTGEIIDGADHHFARLEMSYSDYAKRRVSGGWSGDDRRSRYDPRVAARVVKFIKEKS